MVDLKCCRNLSSPICRPSSWRRSIHSTVDERWLHSMLTALKGTENENEQVSLLRHLNKLLKVSFRNSCAMDLLLT